MTASKGSSLLLDRLTDINLDGVFAAAGLMGLRHTPLQRLLRPHARRLAMLAQEYDRIVGEQGLAKGSSWLAHRMAAGTQVSGDEHVPVAGPAVILANHPGMIDTVALIASLVSRPDLRVMVPDRPFLRALPNVAGQFILMPDHEVGRMGSLRAGVKHLAQGGSLLMFPAGKIEPDPATFGQRKALESVLGWSDSFMLFARRVPQTRFVPAIVSNVISAEAQQHVLTVLRRSVHDKSRLAAALQMALPRFQTLVARVAFGPAQEAFICPQDSLQSAIVDEIRLLLGARAGPAEIGIDKAGAGLGAALQRGELA